MMGNMAPMLKTKETPIASAMGAIIMEDKLPDADEKELSAKAAPRLLLSETREVTTPLDK
jgi:hypothetical protein